MRLLSGPMGTTEETEFQRRQGWWLRVARERAGKSQAGAAEMIGLSKNSKSSISDYENGVTPVPLRTLRRLASYYGVPLKVFIEPEPTAAERLDDLAAGVSELEREDWHSGEAGPPKAEAEPGAWRRTPAA